MVFKMNKILDLEHYWLLLVILKRQEAEMPLTFPFLQGL